MANNNKINAMENNANEVIKEVIISSSPAQKNSKQSIFSGNFTPVTAILGAVAVLSLILNVILIIKMPVAGADTNVAAKTQPAAPTADAPAAKPDAVQTFVITKDDHVRGDFNAPITLVEFSDFECPFCSKHAPTIDKILADYKGKVRVVFKSFPLGFHKNAQKASESAECASEQGKFWEMHDILFKNQPTGFSTEKFKQWAKEIGLDSGKFNNCLDTDKYAAKVKADADEGAQKGVEGTPATFVNGTLVSGAVPYAQFKTIIDGLLK